MMGGGIYAGVYVLERYADFWQASRVEGEVFAVVGVVREVVFGEGGGARDEDLFVDLDQRLEVYVIGQV